jgi:hypothetical protein
MISIPFRILNDVIVIGVERIAIGMPCGMFGDREMSCCLLTPLRRLH